MKAAETKNSLPTNILKAWEVLELLTVQPFNDSEKLIEGKETVLTISENNLPWSGYKIQANPQEVIYYKVVIGTVKFPIATHKLYKVFGEEQINKVEDSESILASVVLDGEGNLVDKNNVSISSFAWAFSHVINGDFEKLGQWNDDQAEIICGLKSALTADSGSGITYADLKKAYDYLVERFDIEPRYTNESFFSIKHCHKIDPNQKNQTKKEPPYPIPVNSFYLNDLNAAMDLFKSDCASQLLQRYLGEIEPKSRCDILNDHDSLKELIAPKFIPAAKWPDKGGHSLALLQQAAVNAAMNEVKDGDILAVNGPPGTGKTTLIRDIVASLVTQRAEVMCAFDNPAHAFKKLDAEITCNGKNFSVFSMDSRLKGFEMLVASSNNKAVENISRELPSKNSIIDDLGDLRYFSVMASQVCKTKSWGIIAAALGNSRNRNSFSNAFWWNKDWGLMYYLSQVFNSPLKEQEIKDPITKIKELKVPRIIKENNPPLDYHEALRNWKQAKADFQNKSKAVKAELESLEEVRMLNLNLATLEQNKLKTNLLLENVQQELNNISAELKKSEAELVKCEVKLFQIENEISDHYNLRPWWIARLLKTRSAKKWAIKNELLNRDKRITTSHKINLTNEVSDYHIKYNKFQNDKITYSQNYNKENEIYENAQKKIADYQEKLGKNFVGSGFTSLPPEELHQTAPWLSAGLQQKRDELFIAALKLHKAFIDAAAKPLLRMVSLLMNVFANKALSHPNYKEVLQDMWSSLFLICPCISSTFASMERMFDQLPFGSLGWLIVDEAGQALPQAAVGALLRTRKALIVGDPLQIKPVVSLPEKLTRKICEQFSTDADRYNPPKASAQTLADLASPYFAKIGANNDYRIIGMPLLIHRRCSEPMFSIANKIAYKNLMITAKQAKSSAIITCLGKSLWIHVEGIAEKEQWCAEEGEIVVKLLRRLKAAAVDPNLYIISPFKAVATNLREMIEADEVLKTWKEINTDDWRRNRIGTVHTAQGRESEAIIFVLGAPIDKQDSSRAWARRSKSSQCGSHQS